VLNGYLKSSFIVLLKASLKTSSLLLDVDCYQWPPIGRWLHETAVNQRIHATTVNNLVNRSWNNCINGSTNTI